MNAEIQREQIHEQKQEFLKEMANVEMKKKKKRIIPVVEEDGEKLSPYLYLKRIRISLPLIPLPPSIKRFNANICE